MSGAEATIAGVHLDGSPEEFAGRWESVFSGDGLLQGRIVRGVVAEHLDDGIKVGLPGDTIGVIANDDLENGAIKPKLAVGDEIDVYVTGELNNKMPIAISYAKAQDKRWWDAIAEKFASRTNVPGKIAAKVNGGFTVSIDGRQAFLPGSQVDVRPVADIAPLMQSQQNFRIVKLDRARGNIVVSRREALEEARAEHLAAFMATLSEGQVVKGVVKNLTDYGAFVNLGEMDGLLHITDIAWRRVNHPADMLKVGDVIDVKIIGLKRDKLRISIGMKQLTPDPWADVANRYAAGSRVRGTVTNIADYGAFVELEPGVEGLIHVSEMSWTKKSIHPSKVLATGQRIEVEVLEVDAEKRRIGLGLKQTQPNPWQAFAQANPKGTVVNGTVENIAEYGLFVALGGGIDGLAHISDARPNQFSSDEILKRYKEGDAVVAEVLEVDVERERVSLGLLLS